MTQETINEVPALVTKESACHQLNICERTLLRWISRGELETVRLGQRLLIKASSLSRVLTDGTKGGYKRTEEHKRKLRENIARASKAAAKEQP